MSLFTRKNVLVIEAMELPGYLLDSLSIHHKFANDTVMKFYSEFSPYNGKTWKDTLTEEGLRSYYEDQSHMNNYDGTFEGFIKEYNLEIEKWLIDQKLDLEGVEDIIFDISW